MHFLCIARESLAELQTQLLLCMDLNFIEENVIIEIYDRLIEIDKMICGLYNHLQTK